MYVPMSEIEQEFVSRLVDQGDLRVLVHGWGEIPRPVVTHGDGQVVIPMTLTFDRPEVPIPVSFFDLELATHSGITLFREQQSTLYGNHPLMVGAGTVLEMVWHIGVKNIDPMLIKALMPGTVGLTSRLIDRDTGDVTVTGNMSLNTERRRLLEELRRNEAAVLQWARSSKTP
jgi:hypothetical protein